MKVLKFGAVWCSGCLVMRPRWKEIEEENPWLVTEYYDFDTDKNEVIKYGIDKNLPIFVLIGKDGKEFMRLSGEISKKKIEEILAENKDK